MHYATKLSICMESTMFKYHLTEHCFGMKSQYFPLDGASMLSNEVLENLTDCNIWMILDVYMGKLAK